MVIARAVGLLSRTITGGGGHALPGKLAQILDSSLTLRLSEQLPSGVVLVTGTNGKTTTTRLIVAGLRAAGETVITNPTGSNMRQGILSALLASCDSRGRVGGTVAVFEVDEITLPLVADQLRPRLIVVLNLFRDQLDRNTDLDIVAQRLLEGMRATGAAALLNADDPSVADLARRAESTQATYFGIDDASLAGRASTQGQSDAARCPLCGTELTYTTVFFAQMGHYSCTRGDFHRPTPTAALTKTGASTKDGTTFTMSIDGNEQEAQTPSPGVYSLYNSLAALATLSLLEVDPATAASAVSTCTPAFGRAEEIEIDGRRIRLLLVKNPVGLTQVIDTYLVDDPDSPLLMALNDAAADGRDVSWIWDAPLELLGGRGGTVVAAGTRSADLALRLTYAGLDTLARPGYDDGLNELLRHVPAGGSGFALGNYTAMLGLRKAMLSRAARQVAA